MLIVHSNLLCATVRTLSAIAFFSVACDVSAQTSSTDTMLPPVVVTASRIEQPQIDALPHTTVITAEDIRNNPVTDLPSLLRREAGVQLTQTGGPGQLTSLFMRGAPPSEALILVDGVPVRRQGFSPLPALEHILPEQIDHIEIVRGNVSAIYGTSAIGGVIQIFTKQGSGPAAFNLSTEIGSRGTAQLTGGVSGKTGDTRYALSMTRYKTDGISANNTTQYPTENPDKNGDRNTSVSANLSQEWDRGHEIGLRAYDNDGKNSYDGGGFGAPTDANYAHSKQQSLAAFSKDRFTSNWMSTVTLSQTATRNENVNVSSSPYTIRDNGDATLLQWANEINLLTNWILNAGADLGREKLDAFSNFAGFVTENTYSRSTSSVYSGLNGKFDSHQLQLNVRYDQVGGAGSDVTGFLGYGYLITDNIKLIANASTAFLAPNLAQLYDGISKNPNLQSEKSKSLELGTQYTAGKTILRATAFRTLTKNQFGIDPNECFSGAHPASCPTFNIAKSSNKGLELSATGKIADIDSRLALTFQQPRDETSRDILIRRAHTLASLSLAKSLGAWKVGSDFQYASSRPDVDFTAPSTSNKRELSPYWLANFNTRYQINKTLSAYGRIENAFNRDYQTAYGYNQPPRGVFVGLNWQQ